MKAGNSVREHPLQQSLRLSFCRVAVVLIRPARGRLPRLQLKCVALAGICRERGLFFWRRQAAFFVRLSAGEAVQCAPGCDDVGGEIRNAPFRGKRSYGVTICGSGRRRATQRNRRLPVARCGLIQAYNTADPSFCCELDSGCASHGTNSDQRNNRLTK
jgi:hypothetical protein